MRLLPILWAETPTAEDWSRLGAAREALGYTELIQPAHALQGSPGPVLAIGVVPDWLTDFGWVSSTEDEVRLQKALEYCLREDLQDVNTSMAALMGAWMGTEVAFVGEEEFGEYA